MFEHDDVNLRPFYQVDQASCKRGVPQPWVPCDLLLQQCCFADLPKACVTGHASAHSGHHVTQLTQASPRFVNQTVATTWEWTNADVIDA